MPESYLQPGLNGRRKQKEERGRWNGGMFLAISPLLPPSPRLLLSSFALEIARLRRRNGAEVPVREKRRKKEKKKENKEREREREREREKGEEGT
jgi:flagellar biosynthesis component FlhA